ncbi:EAL and HDOD domain-containing protein [Thiomicrospira microaerophila]|uniref:EAL and HDOD domain-containing protein n=1 Tax=Thiomicrospira microaerophila TaxID=406020 RepID=UPI0005CB339D|nr:EAL domain-containing protein [Thiomicrospira microaerophila]
MDLVDIFIGRQPIFTKKTRVYGYEMLFRSSNQHNFAQFSQAEKATASVLANLLGDFGFHHVVGEGNKAFINFSEALLLDETELILSPRDVVIEILEDVKVTPRLIERVKRLKKRGYSIALDDYIFDSDLSKLEPYADIIKVDVLAIEQAGLDITRHVERLLDKGMMLLAEKVETLAQFEAYSRMGFKLFQGYFFAKPNVIQGRSLPTNQANLLRLLVELNKPNDEACLSDVVLLVSHDVSLSQKVINMISTFNVNVKVNSIHEAVLRFGLDRLRAWVNIMLLSGVENKPTELFKTALVRAKFAEQMGGVLGGAKPETYFTVGLFSVLDAVFDLPKPGLIKKMELNDDIKGALMEHKGPLGYALCCVKEIEKGTFDFRLPGRVEVLNTARWYLESIHYAEKVLSSLK